MASFPSITTFFPFSLLIKSLILGTSKKHDKRNHMKEWNNVYKKIPSKIVLCSCFLYEKEAGDFLVFVLSSGRCFMGGFHAVPMF